MADDRKKPPTSQTVPGLPRRNANSTVGRPLPPDESFSTEDILRQLGVDPAESKPRESVQETILEAKDSAPPPPGHKITPSDSTWTGQFFEFVGLGFILVPPGLLGEAFLKNEPINLPLLLAIFAAFWTVGGLALFAGKTWPKWRPSNEAVAAAIEKGARSIWVWLVIFLG